MAVESGGRLNARNPLSSALGPYQFIRETFLDVIKRRFPELGTGKTDDEILALRADAVIARNAALVYTRENANYLSTHSQPVTPGHLRLTFFIGPGAALKVLEARPDDALSGILSEAAINANPSLGKMTAGQLIERASHEAGAGVIAVQGLRPATLGAAERPRIAVQCNLKLPSCKKWLAMAEKRSSYKKEAAPAQVVARR
jgi:hypothetical protein